MADAHREEIAKLESLYASNPGGRVFVHLAEAYRKAGELELARSILDEGLVRHPAAASGYVVLGRVLSDLGDADGAGDAFRAVLQLDPGNLVALQGLGDLARAGGRFDEAREHYRELLARNPASDEARETLAQLELQSAGPSAEAPRQDAAAAEGPGPETGPMEAGWAVAPLAEAPHEGESEEAQALASGVTGRSEPPVGVDMDVAGDEPVDEPHAGIAGGTDGAADAQSAPVTAWSAAPGDTADAVPAEPVTWHADLDVEAVRAPEPGDTGLLPTTEPLDSELFDASGLLDLDGLETTSVMAGAESSEEGTDAGLDRIALDETFLEAVEVGTEGGVEERGEPGAVAGDVELGQLDDLRSLSDAEEAAGGAFEDAGSLGSVEALGQVEPFDEVEPFADIAALGELEVLQEAGAGASAPPAEAEAEPSAVEPLGDLAAAGAEAEPPAVEQLADSGGPAAVGTQPADQLPEAAGLETETMGDLYLGQGFAERAADVYRALLRRRPDDERLLAKLEEAESAARAISAAAAPDAAEAGRAAEPDEEGGEEWLRRAGSAWTGEGGGDAAEATPFAWGGAGEDEPEQGPAIAEYLQQLVSWRTASDEAAAADAAAEAFADVGSWLGRGSGGEAEAVRAGQSEGAVPERGGGAPAKTDSVETAFDEWFGPAPSQAAGAAEPGAGGDEEDEDLAMFRSWLQSLKK